VSFTGEPAASPSFLVIREGRRVAMVPAHRRFSGRRRPAGERCPGGNATGSGPAGDVAILAAHLD
jgi:hypothetical protein